MSSTYSSASCSQAEEQLLNNVEVPLADAQKIVAYCSKLKHGSAAGTESSTIDATTPLVSGWLCKRGPTNLFRWVRYYCELYPNILIYFADETRRQKKGDILLCSVSRACSFGDPDAPGDAIQYYQRTPYGFVLDPQPEKGKRRRFFYFDAADEKEFKKWSRAINWKVRKTIAVSSGVLDLLRSGNASASSSRARLCSASSLELTASDCSSPASRNRCDTDTSWLSNQSDPSPGAETLVSKESDASSPRLKRAGSNESKASNQSAVSAPLANVSMSVPEFAKLLNEVDSEAWTPRNVGMLLQVLTSYKANHLTLWTLSEAFAQVVNELLEQSNKESTLAGVLSNCTADDLALHLPKSSVAPRSKTIKVPHNHSESKREDPFWKSRCLHLKEKGTLKLVLLQAWSVPKMDVLSWADPYLVIEVHMTGHGLVASGQSKTINDSSEPIWNEAIFLPALEGKHAGRYDLPPVEWDPSLTSITLRLFDEDYMTSDDFIGECTIPLLDVLERKVSKVMLWDKNCNPVISRRHVRASPCMLSFYLDLSTKPSSWPEPPLCHEYNAKDYPYHVFMITRGTRGDVQPFVALARGLAEQCGCLVTLCTEVRWKEFVKSNAQVSRGKIRFRPSGGDTLPRVESHMWAVQAKTELMQMAILACCESEFFCSSSVFLTHISDMELEPKPVDLIICGLTTAGVGLLLSELCSKTLSLFILQPSVIPSQDQNWVAVETIRSRGNTGFLDDLRKAFFTSHRALAVFKGIAEEHPFAQCTITKLRAMFGLEPRPTWTAVKESQVPVVIPMVEGTFERPSDWGSNVVMTNFIFLRKPKAKSALGEHLEKFIAGARGASGKIALMTFSSMAVSRRKILECCSMMIEQCKFGLHMIYVGQEHGDCPEPLVHKAAELTKQGRFLRLTSADFGLLFKEIDCFIVHGGLGTTVEALRMKKPCTVTGPLLLDQRFWGKLVFEKGLGTDMVHIDDFHRTCVEFADNALDPSDPRGWQKNARSLDWGDEDDDGVRANTNFFYDLLEKGSTNRGTASKLRTDSDMGIAMTSVQSFLNK